MELSHDKIVNFEYCQFCHYRKCPEDVEPCSDCLDNPSNVDSHRPIHFKDTREFNMILKKESNKSNGNLH